MSRLGRESSTEVASLLPRDTEDASLLPWETEVRRCELLRAETVVTTTSERFISCGLVWLTSQTHGSTGIKRFPS